ncbi:type II secretion system minor pseudopilin GspK [Bordetella sp. N]|uniref:type II secretion system minor pseudopilin GspK n=1 Tax=Bordetella sp. N TaxID=1746199 RepID=UPI00070BD985|nr:type II secretion system minor pseudopilin GspK [Bordetella sp. N]ALM86679.1 general secretion pathway protein GspK [Bordetella sp. N]
MRPEASSGARARRAQRGMAVVSALIVVAVVAALTSGLFMRQTSAIRQMENEQARAQARWLLVSGLDWARLVVRESLRREPTIHAGQLWTVPVQDTRLERPGDGRVAIFSGSIEDEQGKFNVYNVARGGLIMPDQVVVLARLLTALQVPDGLAQTLAQRVALTQPSKPVTDPNGAIIRQGAPPRAPAPRGIEDLLANLNLDPALRRDLQRTLTYLPAATTVNVNTAPPEVIAALVPDMTMAQARIVVGERERGAWFNDAADFTNRLGGVGVQNTPEGIGATSAWFSATGTVAYERVHLVMRALIQSAADQSTEIVWKREIH